MFATEYKSTAHIGSWPLVHVAYGLDPLTGKAKTARGIIAIGNRATGLIAMGGIAKGIIAFGGITFGVFAIGGLGVGVLTFAGLGIGLLFCYGGLAIGTMAYGGLAIGYAAVGGLALGYYAMGGAAYGVHALGGRFNDREARQVYDALKPIFGPRFIIIAMSLFVALEAIVIGTRIWVQRKTASLTKPVTSKSPPPR
jgi:hypothetical protein